MGGILVLLFVSLKTSSELLEQMAIFNTKCFPQSNFIIIWPAENFFLAYYLKRTCTFRNSHNTTCHISSLKFLSEHHRLRSSMPRKRHSFKELLDGSTKSYCCDNLVDIRGLTQLKHAKNKIVDKIQEIIICLENARRQKRVAAMYIGKTYIPCKEVMINARTLWRAAHGKSKELKIAGRTTRRRNTERMVWLSWQQWLRKPFHYGVRIHHGTELCLLPLSSACCTIS